MKKNQKGFTLVELIVVIAIMAILAGIAVPTYAAYIKEAHKGADKQTVGNLIYAVRLADAADSGLFDENAIGLIGITRDGTTAAGTRDQDAFAAALEKAVGDLSEVKLTCDDWAGSVSGEVLKTAVDNLQDYIDNGQVAIYADEIDELWNDVAGLLRTYGRGNTSPGQYLKKAADFAVKDGTADAWASADEFKDTDGGEAKTSMELARSCAFASYLQKHSDQYEVSDDFLNALKSPTGAMFLLFSRMAGAQQGELGMAGKILAGVTEEEFERLKPAAAAYLEEQAKADALAYVGIMKTVQEVTGTGEGQYDPKDDEYLDIMGSYANILGGVMPGQDYSSITAMADNLQDDGSVVLISVSKSGGILDFRVSPTEAKP